PQEKAKHRNLVMRNSAAAVENLVYSTCAFGPGLWEDSERICNLELKKTSIDLGKWLVIRQCTKYIVIYLRLCSMLCTMAILVHGMDVKAYLRSMIPHLESGMKLSKSKDILSAEEVMQWSQSLEKLLANQTGQSVFGNFLKSEFSEENIEFWLACEDYKKTESELLSSKAENIYKVFVHSDAVKQINIDFRTRESTAKRIKAPTPTSFDEAQKVIYTLMEKDSYPRFLKSNIYLNLLNDLQANSLKLTRSESLTATVWRPVFQRKHQPNQFFEVQTELLFHKPFYNTMHYEAVIFKADEDELQAMSLCIDIVCALLNDRGLSELFSGLDHLLILTGTTGGHCYNLEYNTHETKRDFGGGSSPKPVTTENKGSERHSLKNGDLPSNPVSIVHAVLPVTLNFCPHSLLESALQPHDAYPVIFFPSLMSSTSTMDTCYQIPSHTEEFAGTHHKH
ncbi:hypothetical protein STEG23_017070, partial [Scotinomys teguina]